MMKLALYVALLTGLKARLGLAEQTCFLPDGSKAPGPYVVCDPTAKASSCCGSFGECLTNGMCRPRSVSTNQNGFWRQACTDQSWRSSVCPNYCDDGKTDPGSRQASRFIESCSYGTYCCSNYTLWQTGSYTCCNQPQLLFNAAAPAYLSGPSYSISYFAQPTPGPAQSSSLSSSSTASKGSSSTASSAAPTSSSSSSSSSSPGLSTGDQVAIGVSVSIGSIVIAVAILAYICIRRSRRRNRVEEKQQSAITATAGEGIAASYAGSTVDGRHSFEPSMLASQEPSVRAKYAASETTPTNTPHAPGDIQRPAELDGAILRELPAESLQKPPRVEQRSELE